MKTPRVNEILENDEDEAETIRMFRAISIQLGLAIGTSIGWAKAGNKTIDDDHGELYDAWEKLADMVMEFALEK